MAKSLIIIGGGLAGLAAGYYGQINGYKTQVFEVDSQPGGLCKAWRRDDYIFPTSFRWLVGTSPKSHLHRLWEELGAAPMEGFFIPEVFARIEGQPDAALTVYADIDRFVAHLKDLASDDARAIKQLAKAAHLFAEFDPPLDKAVGHLGWMNGFAVDRRRRAFTQAFKRYRHTSVRTFAAEFGSPVLHSVFPRLIDLPDYPMAGLLMQMAWLQNGNLGYPVGGLGRMAETIAHHYEAAGGYIRYEVRVKRVLVEDGKAVGVALEDGTKCPADRVISTCDGYTTLFDLLGGEYVDKSVREFYESLPMRRPYLQVSLGVARDFSDIPPMFSFVLDEPIDVPGEARECITVQHYGFDPTLAPEGRTVLSVAFTSRYKYWKKLAKDPKRYEEETQRIADMVIRLLDKRFSGLAEQVEAVNVATPVTYEREVGSWRGATGSWLLTTKTVDMPMLQQIPGLKRFYMAGRWVIPGGGAHAAVLSARNTIRTICRKDGREFVSKA